MLAGPPTSIWNDQVPVTGYPQLSRDVEVDVAVVGGGIAGVTTALLLKLAGRRVALLEARRVGRQVTGHSNAKITSLHGLIYADLTARLGEEAAGLYGEAHQAAIRRIADWVEQREIDCAFERRPAYTFTQRPTGWERSRRSTRRPSSSGSRPRCSARSACHTPCSRRSASTIRRSSTRPPTCATSPPTCPAIRASCSRGPARSRSRKASRAR